MQLHYEGRFDKGNPFGKGCILYHKNGKIGYKGTLINGLKEGQGELFEENGTLLLKGEFKNECFYNGEVILDNVTIDYPHEGFFEKVEQTFVGKFLGQCEHGVLKGRIKAKGHRASVVGEFELLAELEECSGLVSSCSVRPKLCKFMNNQGILKYVGQFSEGRLGGYGLSFDETGKMNRKGLFKNGFFQNRGILYDKIGRLTYIGGGMSVKRQEFGAFNYYDRKEGFGVSFYPSGKVCYQGWFFHNKKHGLFGRSFDEKGRLIYVGGFENDKYEGKGIEYGETDRPNGETCFSFRRMGPFEEGQLHGDHCVVFDFGGKISYYGRIRNGAFFEMGTWFTPDGEIDYD